MHITVRLSQKAMGMYIRERISYRPEDKGQTFRDQEGRTSD
jgi:hypothetical protein